MPEPSLAVYKALRGDDNDFRVVIATTYAYAVQAATEAVIRGNGDGIAKAQPPITDVQDEAAAWAASRSAELIADLSSSQKAAVQQVVARAVERGWTDTYTAQQVRKLVGLNAQQALAVDNYRSQMLMNGIKPGLAQSRADKYAQRLQRRRSKEIAANEIHAAYMAGQRQAWKAMRDLGDVSSYAVRIVRVAKDERACRTCKPLNGRRTALVNGTYPVKVGSVLVNMDGPPFHPNCRCIEVLQDLPMGEKPGPHPISKVVDGDGDGFVYDGTPRMRPARPSEKKTVRRVRSTTKIAGKKSMARRKSPVKTGAGQVDLKAAKQAVRHRIRQEYGTQAMRDLDDDTLTAQAVLDMASEEADPNDRSVKYTLGDHPTDEKIASAAGMVRRVIVSHWDTAVAEIEDDDLLEDFPSQKEFVEEVISVMKSDTEGSLSMNAPPIVVSTIMEQRYFKSQFETGHSRGLFDRNARREIEEAWGPPKTTPDHKRPVYGYIDRGHNADTGVNGDVDDVLDYGEIQFIFKKDVRNRATVTWGDSFGEMLAIPLSDLDDLDDDRILAAADTWYGSYAAQMVSERYAEDYGETTSRGGYVEVQYHGGLSIDDIDVVAIHGDTEATLGNVFDWDVDEVEDFIKGLSDEDLAQSDMARELRLIKSLMDNKIRWYFGRDA